MTSRSVDSATYNNQLTRVRKVRSQWFTMLFRWSRISLVRDRKTASPTNAKNTWRRLPRTNPLKLLSHKLSLAITIKSKSKWANKCKLNLSLGCLMSLNGNSRGNHPSKNLWVQDVEAISCHLVRMENLTSTLRFLLPPKSKTIHLCCMLRDSSKVRIPGSLSSSTMRNLWLGYGVKPNWWSSIEKNRI